MPKIVDRREFMATAALGAAAMAAPGSGRAAESSRSETLVGELYRSLSAHQKQAVVHDFDHPLRRHVDNNWQISPHRIGQFFNADQQAMITEIFRKLHSPEFADRVFQHLEDDAGGLGNYSCSLFGEPGGGKFEFVITGRHCTARCDGDSSEGAAFGGPIFYGHEGEGFDEKPDHPSNVYWFQAKRANEVFQALDGKQRAAALLGSARAEAAERTVELKGAGEPLEGLPVAEMSADQRALVEGVIEDLLLPFREEDRREAMKYIRTNGELDSLSMAFYSNHDIGGDGVWDVWQLESPNMLWYFRGAPHVHVWVNIRAEAERRALAAPGPSRFGRRLLRRG